MKRYPLFGVVFLFSFFSLQAQDQPDTINCYEFADSEYQLKTRIILEYNTKGQLTSKKTYGISADEPYPWEWEQYEYNAMDSLASVRRYKFRNVWRPAGLQGDWRPVELQLYQYEGKRLITQKKIVKYQGSDTSGLFDSWEVPEALAAKVAAGQLFKSDWREVGASVITYQYDEKNRLNRKLLYHVNNWTEPSEVWVNSYDGKPVPELVNDARQKLDISTHTYIFSGNQLKQELHKDYQMRAYGINRTQRETYEYTSTGQLKKILRYRDMQNRDKYGKLEKPDETLVEKRSFEYKDGKLVSENVEFREGFNFMRYSFPHKGASTYYYTYLGGWKNTWFSPSEKADIKTKNKWISYSIRYDEEEIPDMVDTHEMVYDNKGRLIEERYVEDYSVFDAYGKPDKNAKSFKIRYGYSK